MENFNQSRKVYNELREVQRNQEQNQVRKINTQKKSSLNPLNKGKVKDVVRFLNQVVNSFTR